jgi:hypothetical protein
LFLEHWFQLYQYTLAEFLNAAIAEMLSISFGNPAALYVLALLMLFAAFFFPLPFLALWTIQLFSFYVLLP